MTRGKLNSSLIGTILIILTLLLTPAASAQVPVVPANDNFVAATVVGVIPFSATQLTDGATVEVTASPIVPCANPPAALPDVWYTYTPAATGWVQVDTGGSFTDTVLSVWTGTSGALTNVACNDDFLGLDLASQLTFNAAAATTYYINVVGHAGSSGEITLNVNAGTPPSPPPANDNIAAATVIATAPYTSPVGDTTVGATVEAMDPVLPCTIPGQPGSVWYAYTPAAGGTATISTASSAIDTVLGVWTGTPGALTNAACNDDYPGIGLQSQAIVPVTAATPYYIEVAGVNSEPGAIALSVTFVAGPPPSRPTMMWQPPPFSWLGR